MDQFDVVVLGISEVDPKYRKLYGELSQLYHSLTALVEETDLTYEQECLIEEMQAACVSAARIIVNKD